MTAGSRNRFALEILATLMIPVVTMAVAAASEVFAQDWIMQGQLGLIEIWLKSQFWPFGVVAVISVWGLFTVVEVNRAGLPAFRYRIPALAGVLAVVGMGLAWAGAVPNGPAQRPPNILLVVVDTLRADRLGIYGYSRNTSPTLDKLAASGALVEFAYSDSSWTRPSVASIYTGLGPARHLVLDYDDALGKSFLTIAERARNIGFFTGLVGSRNYNLSADFNMTQGFEWQLFEPRSHADHVIGKYLPAALDKAGDRPFFIHLHLMDVHTPYFANVDSLKFASNPRMAQRYAPGSHRFSMEYVRERANMDFGDALSRDYVSDVYDGQVHFIDRQMATLLNVLEDYDRLDDTLVIFTSDHGEEIWEHGAFGHGHAFWQQVIRIPMLAFGAGVAPRRIAGPVSGAGLYDLMNRVMTRAASPDAALAALDNAAEQPRWALVAGMPDGDRSQVVAVGRGGKVVFELADAGGHWNLHQETATFLNTDDQVVKLDSLEQIEAARGFLSAEFAALSLYERRSTELAPAKLEQLRSLGYVQ